ncbi:hypothetical protein EC968_004415, partial [Mortierella alpina]
VFQAFVMKNSCIPFLLAALLGTSCGDPSRIPATGEGLQLDLDGALDLKTLGITTVPIGGATVFDEGVGLRVAKGSYLDYNTQNLENGKVNFMGGVQLGKGSKKMTISAVSLDIKSGQFTAKVDNKDKIPFGSVDVSQIEFEKPEGLTLLSVTLDHEFVLAPSVPAAINEALGLHIDADEDIDLEDANVVFDVDLAFGSKVNIALVSAFRLEDEIAIDAILDLKKFRDLDI